MVEDLTSDPYKPADMSTSAMAAVLIAAITSCTNTSNPSVMLASGLLAKKAVERGLTDQLRGEDLAGTPGSRVVSDYLDKTGLPAIPVDQARLQHLSASAAPHAVGNSGPLHPAIEDAMAPKRPCLHFASVLSGNRNFEARIHQNIKANFLMSPPLVVAFTLPVASIST